MFGFLNINKPRGITSHDVISYLRRVTKIKQIGHTGTLDPMAEGVLPVAIGKASRLIEYLDEDKGYIAGIKFGQTSTTCDLEGEITSINCDFVEREIVEATLRTFEGEIEQIPPAYSAVHYNGKRLYELARSGYIPDDIPKRNVFISKIFLIDFDYSMQTASIEIECSKGTYIRSILRDLGEKLGTGAVMTSLLRTKSGMFRIDNAKLLDMIQDSDDVKDSLINPLDVLSFKRYCISDIELEKISHGQQIEASNDFQDDSMVILEHKNKVSAVANVQNSKFVVKKVFVV